MGALPVFVALLLLTACGKEPPHLLGVREVRPTAVEPRDELHILGDGFIEGATATIVFDGITHRVGQEPEPVRIETSATANSRQDLRLSLTPKLVNQFLGQRGDVRHATFRGELEVAFAPRTQGAPPITGSLGPIELDCFATPGELYPSGGSDLDSTEEGNAHAQLVERFGWKLKRSDDGAVCIDEIAESHTASPLTEGDCIQRFEGVNVLSALDLAPYEGLGRAQVLVRRAGFADAIPVTLDVSGLRPQPPKAWHWTLVATAILVFVLVLCRSPLGMGLALLESALAQALDSRARRRGRALRWGGLVLRLLPFICVSGLFAAAGTGALRMLRDFDLLLIYAGSSALLTLALMLGGGKTARGWSITAAAATLLRGSAVQLTILVGIGTAVLQHASLSLLGASSGQGAAVWDYGMFRSLGSYLASLALACSVVLLGLTRLGERPRHSGQLTQLLLDVHTWSAAGLWLYVYLGGVNVPSFLHELPLPPAALVLGVFQLKLTLVFVAISWLRSILPQVSERNSSPVFWRWLLPLTVVAAITDLVWVSGSWPLWMQQASTRALIVTTLLLVLGAGLRLLAGKRTPAAAAPVNPWI